MTMWNNKQFSFIKINFLLRFNICNKPIHFLCKTISCTNTFLTLLIFKKENKVEVRLLIQLGGVFLLSAS
jgi:hypothetical protein